MEFLEWVLENGITTAAFVIGAFFVFFAIVGAFSGRELKPPERIMLAAFGLVSVGLGLFFSPQTVRPPHQTPTPVPEVVQSPSATSPMKYEPTPYDSPTPVPEVAQQPSPAARTEPTQTPTVSPDSADSACQAIMGKLPDSPEEVRSLFGIPDDKRVWMITEICPEAPNGFVVEDSPSHITLQIPEGGCIDAYVDAAFSDETVPERTGGGRRAYSGSVTATSLTYRIAGCELKP